MTEAEFIAAVLRNPINATILTRLPQLHASDAWLVSGALFQTVWNVQTHRAPEYGIRDYDVFYFDPDTSWDAETTLSNAPNSAFADVDAAIEIRNQARVHLWYRSEIRRTLPASDAHDRRHRSFSYAQRTSGYSRARRKP